MGECPTSIKYALCPPMNFVYVFGNFYLGHKGTIHNKLSLLISDIPGVGEILHTMNDVIPDDAYNRYLHDFMEMVYESDDRTMDAELEVRNLHNNSWDNNIS